MKKIIAFVSYILITLLVISSCVDNGNTSDNSLVDSFSRSTVSDLTTSEEIIDPHKTNAGKSELAPIIELPIGDGEGEIGYIIVEVGGFNSGPEDFTILPDGTIMILDCVNKRILSFRDNKLTESFMNWLKKVPSAQ